MVKPNWLTMGSGKMSLFPKKVEYPFKYTRLMTRQGASVDNETMNQ